MSDAYPPAGHTDVQAAAKLANLIATARVAMVMLVLVAGVVLGAMASDLLVVVGGLVVAVALHVNFGWLEQVLRLLIGIAYNTAEAAGIGPRTSADESVRAD